MADLMNSGEATFDSLAKKYKNFMVPAVKIKMKGTDVISSLKLAVENVSVTLALGTAGSCSFSVVNAYDAKSSKFDSQVLSKLRPGVIFEVELGYDSATTSVFKGYISEVTMKFSDMPTIDITGMDVCKLMMEGSRRMLKHPVKNYSDAFTKVMEKYKKLCPTLVVDKTTDELGEDGVAQTRSDFHFIVKDIADKADREFFVLGDTAYFRTPQKNKTPITTLQWGSSLLSFSRSTSYSLAEIMVIGFDEDTNKTIVGKSKVKSEDEQEAVVAVPSPMVIQDPDATSDKKAKTRAKAEMRKRVLKGQLGSAVSIGLPEIVPGRFIKLDKLSPDQNKKYYISKVQHSFGSDGFTTSFNIGGWD